MTIWRILFIDSDACESLLIHHNQTRGNVWWRARFINSRTVNEKLKYTHQLLKVFFFLSLSLSILPDTICMRHQTVCCVAHSRLKICASCLDSLCGFSQLFIHATGRNAKKVTKRRNGTNVKEKKTKNKSRERERDIRRRTQWKHTTSGGRMRRRIRWKLQLHTRQETVVGV